MPILPVGSVVTVLTPPGPHLVATVPTTCPHLRCNRHNYNGIKGLQSGCSTSSRLQLRVESGQVVAIPPGCDGSAGGRVVPVVPSVPTT